MVEAMHHDGFGEGPQDAAMHRQTRTQPTRAAPLVAPAADAGAKRAGACLGSTHGSKHVGFAPGARRT